MLREKCPNTEFFLARIFPHSDWIRRDTKYVGKYGPEWLRIRILFTQCDGGSNVLEFKKTLRMMIRFKFLSLKLLYIVWIWIIPLTLVVIGSTLYDLLALIDVHSLTIFTGKNSCFAEFSTKIHWNNSLKVWLLLTFFISLHNQ